MEDILTRIERRIEIRKLAPTGNDKMTDGLVDILTEASAEIRSLRAQNNIDRFSSLDEIKENLIEQFTSWRDSCSPDTDKHLFWEGYRLAMSDVIADIKRMNNGNKISE